jgi:hypothetical protein
MVIAAMQQVCTEDEIGFRHENAVVLHRTAAR